MSYYNNDKKRKRSKKRILLRRIKRMFFSKKAVEGSITIFLVIIMLPMFIFSFSVVDLCKIFMASETTRSAEDLALNSALTAYDQALKDMYGLLATSSTEAELTEKVKEYYVATLESNGIPVDSSTNFNSLLSSILQTGIPDNLGDNNSFLKLYSSNVTGKDSPISVSPLAVSAVSNPAVMHRQIVEYMKYRGPVYLVTGTLEKLNAFSDLNNQTTATNAKLDFEQTLSNINNDAIKAYVMLELFFANADELETTTSNPYIPYPNDPTASGLISSYKCDVTSALKFSSFYSNGNFSIDSNVDILKDKVSYGAAAYSPFAGAYQSNGSIKLNEDVNNMLNADNITAEEEYKGDVEKLLEDLFDKADDIQQKYITNAIYIPDTNGSQFYTALSELDKLAGGNLSASYDYVNRGYDIVWVYAPLFDGTDNYRTDLDFAKDIKELAALYIKVVKHKNYLENHATNTENSDSETESDDEDAEDTEEEDDTIDKDDVIEYLDTVDENVTDNLKNGVDKVKEYTDKWRTNAISNYNLFCSQLNELYTTVKSQMTLLNELVKTDGVLDTIYKEFVTAQQQAGTYKNAVDNVQTESVKGSFNAQYVNEAKDIQALKIEDLNALKEPLQKQLWVYTDIFSMLDSFKFFNTKIIGQNIALDSVMSSYVRNTNGFNGSVSVGSVQFAAISSTCETERAVDNLGVWNDSNVKNTITSNDFYKKIKEIGVPVEHKDTNDDAKKSIQDNGTKVKSDEVLNNSGVSTDNGNSSGDGNSQNNNTEDKNSSDDFDPSKYVLFSDYVKTIKQDYTLPGGDTSTVKGDVTVDKDSDNSAVKNNATSILSEVGNFFAKLAEAGRDKLYITEYLTENFSCYTTNKNNDDKKDEAMISGVQFYDKDKDKANVVWYGGEMEYLLYGLSSKDQNIAAAGGTIFAIRFALNLIYSFTDPEINSFTLAAATAAGGLFPFSIPLIKTVLHICLSLAESAYDLKVLLDGGTVPIYKTQSTWVCKGTGVLREVAADVAEKAVDYAVDKATDALAAQIDNLAENAEDEVIQGLDGFEATVNQEIDSIKGQIESDIMSPIYEVIQKAVTSSERNRANIEAMLRETFEQTKIAINTSDAGSNNGIVKQLEEEMLNYVDSQIGNIAQTIADNFDYFQTSLLGVTADDIKDGFEKISEKFNSIFETITNKVESYRKQIEKTLTDTIRNIAAEAKKGVEHTAKTVKDTIKTSLDKGLRGREDVNINYGGKASVSAMLSMDYKDYLYLFTALGLIVNENNILQRAAVLMSANVSKYSGSTYDTNKACTIIGSSASSKIKTVFWGSYWDEAGNRWVIPANNTFTIMKSSYAGY